MLLEYIALLFFGILVMLITILIPLLSTVLVYQQNYQEKISSYECGFEPFQNYMPQFEIRYYLLAILFLIFDLELAFLMPWVVTLDFLSYYAIFSMFFFFFFLVLAYFYEWLRGGLE